MNNLGKKVIFNKKNIRCDINTINKLENKTIYINLKGWFKPIFEEENYTRLINNFNKEIKKTLYNEIKNINYLDDNFIVDLNMRSIGLSVNKKSHICCTITLFNDNTDFEIVSEKINKIINKIITNCFEKNKYFIFTKNKK